VKSQTNALGFCVYNSNFFSFHPVFTLNQKLLLKQKQKKNSAAASDPIHTEAKACREGVVTAVNQLQYFHFARHSVNER
jgi:hypothetical protein